MTDTLKFCDECGAAVGSSCTPDCSTLTPDEAETAAKTLGIADPERAE